mmetsp:Transcript_69737/g.220793  ORF Transcript_69737/g.220793 Transcript_69737/m.220793 type:complete len:426 (-) Transcript_69737:99-1376(-)
MQQLTNPPGIFEAPERTTKTLAPAVVREIHVVGVRPPRGVPRVGHANSWEREPLPQPRPPRHEVHVERHLRLVVVVGVLLGRLLLEEVVLRGVGPEPEYGDLLAEPEHHEHRLKPGGVRERHVAPDLLDLLHGLGGPLKALPFIVERDAVGKLVHHRVDDKDARLHVQLAAPLDRLEVLWEEEERDQRDLGTVGEARAVRRLPARRHLPPVDERHRRLAPHVLLEARGGGVVDAQHHRMVVDLLPHLHALHVPAIPHHSARVPRLPPPWHALPNPLVLVDLPLDAREEGVQHVGPVPAQRHGVQVPPVQAGWVRMRPAPRSRGGRRRVRYFNAKPHVAPLAPIRAANVGGRWQRRAGGSAPLLDSPVVLLHVGYMVHGEADEKHGHQHQGQFPTPRPAAQVPGPHLAPEVAVLPLGTNHPPTQGG